MLSNTLCVIEKMIKQLNSDLDATPIVEFFRNYKKGMWIYPGVLKRKFSLDMNQVYELLSSLEKEGILQSYYELYCGHCQKSMGTVELFNQLPDYFECEICGEELPALENSVIIYKVVRDD